MIALSARLQLSKGFFGGPSPYKTVFAAGWSMVHVICCGSINGSAVLVSALGSRRGDCGVLVCCWDKQPLGTTAVQVRSLPIPYMFFFVGLYTFIGVDQCSLLGPWFERCVVCLMAQQQHCAKGCLLKAVTRCGICPTNSVGNLVPSLSCTCCLPGPLCAMCCAWFWCCWWCCSVLGSDSGSFSVPLSRHSQHNQQATR